VRRPIPSIVVQSLGSPLPTWASATCFLDDQPDFELDLIYDAPWLGPQASAFPPRLGHFHPQYRLLVVGQKLDPDCARGGALPRADLLVSAVPSALAKVAEALAILATGHLVIASTCAICSRSLVGRRKNPREVERSFSRESGQHGWCRCSEDLFARQNRTATLAAAASCNS
jgi:hypothetical protein